MAIGFAFAVFALMVLLAVPVHAFADANETGLVAATSDAAGTEQPQEQAEEQPVPFTKKGTYYIVLATNRKKAIGAQGDDRTNLANVVVRKKRNTNLLKYRLVPAGKKGVYYIQNVATGRQLAAKEQTARKANALMSTAYKTKLQRWKIMRFSDGTVTFKNTATGLSLNIGGSGKIGSNVNLRKATNAKTQKFRLIKAKKNKQETVKLDVPCYLQSPQLPTGCESVALTNALRYWGFNLDKTTIANRWLPYGSNGVYNFIGNPHNSSGWIICAPGIANTARRYLDSKKSDLKVKVYHGTSLKELRHYLDEGCPVIVWATDRMRSPGPTRAYRSGYALRGNTHTMVLAGYNPKKGTYYLADSISGEVWRDAKRFESLFNSMGKQAVVISD
jgi:uncharacterized protein YvpB